MNESSMEEFSKDLFSLKITLVGASSVGKTALINQYINHIFLDTTITTIGSDKFSRIETINNIEVKLNVWDTAGQERFRSLSPMFLKGSNIVILVYDITNKNSFEEIEQFWLDIVKENTTNFILSVAANKSDLYQKEEVNEEVGRNFAEREGAYFFITSAKNYNTTQQLFLELAQLYIEKFGVVNNKNQKVLTNKKSKNSLSCC